MSINAVILAAGKGTRMRSQLPKVLHPLADKPMLNWVIDAANSIAAEKVCVIYGHGGEQVKQCCNTDKVCWTLQEQQLGTGHAVQTAFDCISDAEQVLVLYGDTPLIRQQTLQQLLEKTNVNDVGVVTAQFNAPTGLGRIIRNDQNDMIAIVEEKDADMAQKKITEINTGIMLLPVKPLKAWLQQLTCNNAQAELYLTDVIAMAVADGITIKTVQPTSNLEIMGVNNRLQLMQLERGYQHMQAEQLLEQGVMIRDASRFDLRGELVCAEDVSIDINVIIEGKVSLGRGVKIGSNCILKNVTIAADTEILANSILEDSTVGQSCLIGPFARLRPGTQLADNVKVGNFVETKKAIVGEGSKVSHLSYIGDANIGANVNIGAGTITCNYDGVNKFTTTIEDNVFVGSDSQLIAPVTIGKNAYIGAGSSVSKDAPAGKLTIARSRQKVIEAWQPPKKNK